jgi:hypothetical protein
VTVYRLGIKPGGIIGVPSGACTCDNLLVAAANGQVTDISTLTTGTVWVVGQCLKSVAAGAIEVAFAPCTPYQITIASAGSYSLTAPSGH